MLGVLDLRDDSSATVFAKLNAAVCVDPIALVSMRGFRPNEEDEPDALHRHYTHHCHPHCHQVLLTIALALQKIGDAAA